MRVAPLCPPAYGCIVLAYCYFFGIDMPSSGGKYAFILHWVADNAKMENRMKKISLAKMQKMTVTTQVAHYGGCGGPIIIILPF